jgi:8-oxo-dGTP diphosphatase
MTDDVTNKKMVVGFLFSGPRVLLVRKIRPSWQSGLVNGVGGVVEPTETPMDAMRREFREETGCTIDIPWRHFCTEQESFGAWVYFFAAEMPDRSLHAWPLHNDVGEELGWIHHRAVGATHAIGNLRWLIPMARDWREFAEPVLVRPKYDIRERASW